MKTKELIDDFDDVLREGSHNAKRISKPIPMDKDFPISTPTGKANKNGEDKPAVKPGRGATKASREFAQNTGNNQPRCARQYDDYEARYSKTGSLTESKLRESGANIQRALKYMREAEAILEVYEDKFIDQYMNLRKIIDDVWDMSDEWK